MTDVNKVVEIKLLGELIDRVKKSVRGVRFNPDQAEQVILAFQEEVQKKTTQEVRKEEGTEYLVTVQGEASLKIRAKSADLAQYEARQIPMATGRWDQTWFWDEELEVEVKP